MSGTADALCWLHSPSDRFVKQAGESHTKGSLSTPPNMGCPKSHASVTEMAFIGQEIDLFAPPFTTAEAHAGFCRS